jgi:hypothetical protein
LGICPARCPDERQLHRREGGSMSRPDQFYDFIVGGIFEAERLLHALADRFDAGDLHRADAMELADELRGTAYLIGMAMLTYEPERSAYLADNVRPRL